MHKKTFIITLCGFIFGSAAHSIAWAAEAMPGTAFTPVETFCDAKTDTWGAGSKCDVPSQCLEAPEGRFIMEESVHVDIERRYSGTNYSCNWSKAGYATVKGRFQVLNKVCVSGYAHSPSGMDNANVRGGVKCTLNGRHDSVPPM